jgi:hypothetical protein
MDSKIKILPEPTELVVSKWLSFSIVLFLMLIVYMYATDYFNTEGYVSGVLSRDLYLKKLKRYDIGEYVSNYPGLYDEHEPYTYEISKI